MVESLIALLTLTVLEIVLGFDNLVVIALNVARLPKEQQKKGRLIGMAGALGTRVALLCTLSFIMGMTKPALTVMEHGFSVRDLILIAGGFFLVWKSSKELSNAISGFDEASHGAKVNVPSFGRVIIEIAIMDIIFSLDSVITAVGMAKQIGIMILAVVIAMLIMVIFAEVVGDFIQKHSSVKTLALSFLFMIGAVLIAQGMGKEIEKTYIYVPMAFAAAVNVLELRRHSNAAKRAAQTRSDHKAMNASELA